MHAIIGVIVYARTKEEAFDKAEDIVKGLAECEQPFDSYSSFREECARNRWGDLPPVARVMSEGGIRIIDRLWGRTIEIFQKHLSAMKREGDRLGWNWKKLREDRVFRYNCYMVGQYRGRAIRLYDNDGEGIRTLDHLRDALEKGKCLYEKRGKTNPYADLDVWIVPFDVHY